MDTISTDKAPGAIGPYSQAVISKGFLYTSGQLPIDLSGNLAGDTIAEQTQQVLRNLQAILASQNLTPTDVIKTTIYLQSLDDFQSLNAVYGEFFGTNKPARTTIQVAKLPLDAKVEIESVAELG